jgi:alkyldihydroxyacetonephosphate synthase
MTQNNTWLHKWGFKDSYFVVNPDNTLIMAGNRYELSGKKLDYALPFIAESFGINIDWNDCKIENLDKPVYSSFINEDFCTAIEENFSPSHYTFYDQERLVHSHGQASSEEVYKVLYSHIERTVDMVFYCDSQTDVELLIQLATNHHVCLIPFGGGTNVSCALQLPQNETRMVVSVDMRLMNKIEWIDRENLRACVQAGITGKQLEEELSSHGFTCGHEPDSIELSTLGGWIATNASGMKKNRYGNIEQIIENITTITPSGTIEQAQFFSRASIGIQPQNFAFGSEGNLGIITKAVIKIHPLPAVKEYSSVIFPNFELGLKFLNQLARSGSLPASVRLVDNNQFRFAQALKPKATGLKALIDKLTKFYLLKIRRFDSYQMVAATLVFEGSEKEVAYQKANIKSFANQNQGLIGGASNGQRGYMLTFAIAYIRDLLFNFHILGETFETTVPWNKIELVCKSVESKLYQQHQKYNIPGKPYLSYRITQLYHTGVCIYFTLGIYAKGVENPDKIMSEIEHSLRQTIIDNGGSISHHHGVGKIRSSFMKDIISSASIDMLHKLKQSIDPDNVFGVRNNIFDDQFYSPLKLNK